MQNAELISVLNQYKVSHYAKYGIKRLSLFGSAARGTAIGQREPFDYTKWRQDLDADLSVEEISRKAMAFRNKES